MSDPSAECKEKEQISYAPESVSNYSMNPDKPPVITDPADRRILYEQFLRCLDREESLIHYRMSWGLLWNAAGFGAVYGLPKSGLSPNAEIIFSVIVALSGSIVSVMSFIGISAAHRQTNYLIKQINLRLGIKKHNWNRSEFIRPYGNPKSVHPQARWVSRYISLLFIVLWGAYFLYRWHSW